MTATQETVRVEVEAAVAEETPAAAGRADGGVDRVAMEAAAFGETEVPNRILVAPWGEVKSSAGLFIVDDEAAQATIAAFRDHGTDVPVDYEHQTLGGSYSSPSGQAPAAGWIKALSAVTPADAAKEMAKVEAGLWAEVQWTAEALEKLRQRQYRYLSPVALVRRSDKRLMAIHSVALTNKPAIVGMRPVVNAAPTAAPESEGAPDASNAAAARELREVLGLGDTALEGALLLAAAERIRTLEEAEQQRQAAECVSRAMAAGKLTPAQRDWAMGLALRDRAAFEEWEAAAPAMVPLGRLKPPSGGASADVRPRAVGEAARAEWRAHREFLEQVCSEEAYVAQAVRENAAADGVRQ